MRILASDFFLICLSLSKKIQIELPNCTLDEILLDLDTSGNRFKIDTYIFDKGVTS